MEIVWPVLLMWWQTWAIWQHPGSKIWLKSTKLVYWKGTSFYVLWSIMSEVTCIFSCFNNNFKVRQCDVLNWSTSLPVTTVFYPTNVMTTMLVQCHVVMCLCLWQWRNINLNENAAYHNTTSSPQSSYSHKHLSSQNIPLVISNDDMHTTPLNKYK